MNVVCLISDKLLYNRLKSALIPKYVLCIADVKCVCKLLKNIIAMKANSLKLMEVEEDLVSAKLQRIMFSELADQVLVAADSNQALEFYDSNPDIGVILMDNQLPVLNGYEITKRIREYNNTVIIAKRNPIPSEAESVG